MTEVDSKLAWKEGSNLEAEVVGSAVAVETVGAVSREASTRWFCSVCYCLVATKHNLT